ncbi:DUF1471 domain-containing protein [Geodermatophilus sp. SYSU D00700]
MLLRTYDLDDGSVLVVPHVHDPEPSTDAPVLSSFTDFVQSALASGIIGNAGYSMLIALATRLRQGGFISARSRRPTISEMSQAVHESLTAVGVTAITITSVREVTGGNWSAEGTADGRPFIVQANPDGAVRLVRIR